MRSVRLAGDQARWRAWRSRAFQSSASSTVETAKLSIATPVNPGPPSVAESRPRPERAWRWIRPAVVWPCDPLQNAAPSTTTIPGEIAMTELSALWLPILLSAVFVHVASAIIHMGPFWHRNDFPKVPDEEKAR